MAQPVAVPANALRGPDVRIITYPDRKARSFEAAAIEGASITIMEQLGQFPMSENPEQFRRYIAPVLGQIFKQSIPNKQGEHV